MLRYDTGKVRGMSAVAIVALFGAGITLLIAVQGFMWRGVEKQIGAMGKRIDALRTDMDGQIGNLGKRIDSLKADLEGQIGNLAQRVADSEARAEKAHARIESNIREAEDRLTRRIEKQTERIDALHRDLRGLGERVATVEART